METLYWITRLDGINTFLTIVTVVSSVLALFSAVVYASSCVDNGSEETKHYTKTSIKVLIRILPIAVIFGMLSIFTPTTKEALIIYGVGGSIDYLKENQTAKELPDKVIKCADKFLDEYLTEEEAKVVE